MMHVMFPNSEKNLSMIVNECNTCYPISNLPASEDMVALVSWMKLLLTKRLPKRLHQKAYFNKTPLGIVRSEVILVFDEVAVTNLCLSYFSLQNILPTCKSGILHGSKRSERESILLINGQPQF